MTSGWWRRFRRASGTLLGLLGSLAMPVGAVAIAGGGAEAYVTGGRRLLALGALAVAGAVLLLVAGTAIRGARDDGSKPAGGSPAG